MFKKFPEPEEFIYYVHGNENCYECYNLYEVSEVLAQWRRQLKELLNEAIENFKAEKEVRRTEGRINLITEILNALPEEKYGGCGCAWSKSAWNNFGDYIKECKEKQK